jgi:beta-glucosidase/6-phospho-beta-glucosidase/beta-galactosidase
MHIDRSRMDTLSDAGAFQWLAGIEDTFITAPSARTGRTLDEYELTEHYQRWCSDLELFAELGVRSVRYGIPWHRINPARGVWDFSAADRPLERLLELGIEPIVDLVHYGLPPWIEGAFLNPDFDRFMADYSARIAERFVGRIRTYTPLNEPRVTAWYCGKLGWWPPYHRGWRGFIAVLLGVCRGIVSSVHAMRNVDRAIVYAHVDATDLYEASDPSLAAEASRRQALVFLALDLISGRVVAGHELYEWVVSLGVRESDLAWFQTRAIDLDLIGINLYPLFSEKRLVRTANGLRTRMRYASAGIIDRLSDLYWRRYRRPLFISETASEGSVGRRAAWLEDSVDAVRRVRERGIPLVGYTWWPLFALVTWGYREGKKPPDEYLKQMGLWDLHPSTKGLERVRTPLVDRFQDLVRNGSAAVGPLARNADAGDRRPHVP